MNTCYPNRTYVLGQSCGMCVNRVRAPSASFATLLRQDDLYARETPAVLVAPNGHFHTFLRHDEAQLRFAKGRQLGENLYVRQARNTFVRTQVLR